MRYLLHMHTGTRAQAVRAGAAGRPGGQWGGGAAGAAAAGAGADAVAAGRLRGSGAAGAGAGAVGLLQV